jgi:hypothetical protein
LYFLALYFLAGLDQLPPIELVEISTGSIREVFLALALLVARVALADDHDVAVATNHAALLTDRLDAWVDLHCISLFAVFDAASAG